MAYELSSSVKYVNPILGFYTEGPWTSLVEANANIDPAIRVQGMACKIIIAGVAHIYWYRDGVLDADLVEFMGGSSFDPENITTNLSFNPSFDRNINRIRVDGLTTYLQEIILSDIGTILTNVQIDPSGFRRARLEANAIGGFTLSYTSPEGNNQVVILPDKTELSKVGRYISPPAILHDLDIPHKKYVDDLSNSKQDRLAGIVSGCEITVETFSGTPVATNKQIKVSKGLALTNSWYIPTSEYAKATDTVSAEITLCVTGGDFKYYDIVADNTNAITIHEGTPSTSPAHYTINPLTEVLLGFITVGDAVIEEPIPVVSGFIPLSGSDKISGDLFFNASGKYIGRKDKSFIRFNDTQLYANVEDADNQAYISPSVGGGDANVSLYAGDSSDPTRNRIVNVQTGQPITVTGDVLLNNALNYAPSVSLASSTNPALGATASNNVTITGTTTIAGFDTVAEGIIRIVKFAGILQLTHSANLDLPSSANITTAVGDEAVFRSNGGGSWKCIAFMRKDGSALVGGGGSTTETLTVSAFQALNGVYSPSTTYKITDADINLYGGTEIYLTTNHEGILNERGLGKFYNPKYDQTVSGFNVWTNLSSFVATPTTGTWTPQYPSENIFALNTTATGKLFTTINGTKFIPLTGDWSIVTSIQGETTGAQATISGVVLKSYNNGDLVHWGGKTWERDGAVTNGLVGTADDIYTLSGGWTPIMFDPINYNVVYDEIIYDVENDLIVYRNEQNSNIVSINKGYIGGWNPIKDFMWGNVYSESNYKGIGSQTITNSYNGNINFRGSYQLYLTFENNSSQEQLTFENNSFQEQLTFKNNSHQYKLTFENNSFQQKLAFENNSFQQKLTFENNSYQYYLTFKNNSFQYYLTFENHSFQQNLAFENHSFQRNLAFENNSFQNNLAFENNSHQQNLTFENNSYQQDLSFYNASYQENLTFENNSFQNNLTFENISSQINLTFENNSFQGYLTVTGKNQTSISLNNYYYDRTSSPMLASETNLEFKGDLPTITTLDSTTDKIYVKQDNQVKEISTTDLQALIGGGGGSFQTLPTEVTGSLTAANDTYYVNTASATYTDPAGVQGKGFVVLVRGGTATVGGTAYTTGVIYRYFNSAAWSNIMLRDFATITGDITFASGVGTIANNAVTNAKAAQMAANTIKANNTGSTANAADLTTDQFTAMMENAVTVGTAGILTAITSATYKYIRLNNAGATGLGGIVAPSSSYKDLYIWNDTGVTLTLYHDYSGEATATNRIYCGANRSWANNTMLHLKYSVDEARWCTVALDGNTFRSLLQGTGDRLVQASSTGQESATLTTQDIDFTPAQKTSATTGSWVGVYEITISGLKQGQYYADIVGGYNYECHVNDKCNRVPNVNLTPVTTNLIYPLNEISGTSGTLIGDNSYILNNASQVVMSLPTTGVQGDVITISGKGVGGWRVTVPNTQQIVGGLTNTLTNGSGYIQAGQYAAVTLKCITGGTAAVWEIICINPATTLTII